MSRADAATVEPDPAAAARSADVHASVPVPEVMLSKDVVRWLLANGGVAAAYQPIIDVQRHRVIGWEALVRAQHPEVGAISPVALIEAAERHGLLETLTHHIVADAWLTMAHARDLVADPLTIHVNLELSQLGPDEPIVDWLTAIAWPEDVTAIVEITERGDDRWLPEHAAAAARLVAAGSGLAIDDCGAGSSRLGFLHAQAWDIVKLDRQLILELGERQELVLRHLVGLLAALDAVSLAEGVETPEQYRLVRSLGIDQAQGYLLGMPLPGPVMLAELARNGLELQLEA